MKSLFTFFLLACSPAVLAAQGKCSSLQMVHTSKLELALVPYLSELASEGFSGGVVILQNDQVLFESLVGAPGSTPVTDRTLFNVASISKYFTAVLTLKLAEQELIDVSDDLSKLFPNSEVGRRGTLVRDLLVHRSGLGSSYVAERKFKRDAALKVLDDAPFDASRVGAFRYSNDGYNLTAIAIEELFNQPFEQVLKEQVWEPACLSNVNYWGNVDMRDPDVVSQPLERLPRRLLKRNYGMLASSGLLITARDLAQFEYALSRGWVLNETSLAELRQTYDEVSIGKTMMGSFFSQHPSLGAVISARGSEDWGDNAILNHYVDQGFIVAIVTSKGPKEGTGKPYRSQIIEVIEPLLVELSAQQ